MNSVNTWVRLSVIPASPHAWIQRTWLSPTRIWSESKWSCLHFPRLLVSARCSFLAFELSLKCTGVEKDVMFFNNPEKLFSMVCFIHRTSPDTQRWSRLTMAILLWGCSVISCKQSALLESFTLGVKVWPPFRTSTQDSLALCIVHLCRVLPSVHTNYFTCRYRWFLSWRLYEGGFLSALLFKPEGNRVHTTWAGARHVENRKGRPSQHNSSVTSVSNHLLRWISRD